MKKLISFIIAAVLAVTMIVPIYAEEQSEIDSSYAESVSEALEILQALGLYGEYDSTNLNALQEVKRGEFAIFLSKLFNVSENNDENKVYYYDVSKSNSAFGAINAFTDMGVFDGAGDKMFLPDDIITQDEAIVVLIRALGYGGYANEKGGFPSGYINAAGRLKLTSNIKSDKNLNMGNMFIMFKNILEVDMPSTDFNNTKYPLTRGSGNGEDTFIKEYYDAYFKDGMVTAADKTYIYGASNIDDDEVRIDDVVYSAPNIDAGGLLGENVEFVYRDRNNEKTLLWLKQKNKGDVLYLTEPDNEFSFNNSTFSIEYVEKGGEKTKSTALAQNVSIIYNGEVYKDSLSELFDGENFIYSVKLIKSGNSGAYNVIIITGFYDIYVDSINLNDKSVSGKNGEKVSLDEDDYDYLKICGAYGEKVDFSNIQKGTVLSVSENGKHLTAYVSSEKASGTISRSDTDKGLKKIVVNDNSYRVLDKSLDNKVKVGNSIAAYIDYFGYVAYAEVSKEDGFIAYIIGVAESGAWGYKLKAYTQYGEMKVYEIAESVKIDGVSYKTSGEIKNALGRFEQSRIALCKLNKNDEITYIDTTEKGAEEDDTTLLTDVERSTMNYISSQKKFGKKIVINNDTVILCVPENAKNADDSDFRCPSVSEFNEDKYNVESYKLNNDFGVSQVVLVFGYDGWNDPISWDTYIVVEDIFEGVNKDGEKVEVLDGYKEKAPVEMYCTEDYKVSSYVSPGDIIVPYRNGKGYLKDVSVIYKGDSKEIITNNNIGADNRFVTGYVTETNGSYVKFSETKGGFSEIFNFATCPIIVYDKEARNGKFKLGSVTDINTYKTSGEDCSLIALQSAKYIQFVLVYK